MNTTSASAGPLTSLLDEERWRRWRGGGKEEEEEEEEEDNTEAVLLEEGVWGERGGDNLTKMPDINSSHTHAIQSTHYTLH